MSKRVQASPCPLVSRSLPTPMSFTGLQVYMLTPNPNSDPDPDHNLIPDPTPNPNSNHNPRPNPNPNPNSNSDPNPALLHSIRYLKNVLLPLHFRDRYAPQLASGRHMGPSTRALYPGQGHDAGEGEASTSVSGTFGNGDIS